MQTPSRRTRRLSSRRRTTRRNAVIVGASALAVVLAAGVATPAIAATLSGSPSGSTGVATIASLTTDARDASAAATDAIQAADDAGRAVDESGLTVTATVSPAAIAALTAATDKLEPLDFSPAVIVPSLIDDVTAATDRVRTQTAAVTSALTAAEQARDAEIAAAKAKAEAEAAAAKAAAAAAALAAANTPDGAKATARTLASANYGWGDDQFSCLESLWNKESGWNYQAYNSSGATGIPQSLPGEKMASAGADWQTNASTQIAWGLGYINDVYGSPCAAWGHSQATNWY